MLKKLKIKFIGLIMAIAGVMLCGIFGTVYFFTARNLESSSLRAMEELAQAPLQRALLEEWNGQLRLPYFIVQFGLYGDYVAVGEYFDLSDKAQLQQIIDDALASPQAIGVLRQYNLRYYRSGLAFTQRIVFADISGERSALLGLLRSFAFIGAGSLLIFFLLSVLLARWAVRPVERAWEQQRQFVADASHELKTPLTVILTNAELLQEPGCGQEAQARSSAAILTMARQMRGLVEELLELARAEGGAGKAAMERVDLSALLSEAALPFEPLYYERGLTLDSRISPGVAVKGVESQLRQLAEILLDNAMKYSLTPAQVELCLKKQGARCLLTVTNPAEELSPEELKDIFKRFYRVDKARSMNRSYGLGLSIAEAVTLRHGGKIWAESRDGLIRFCVELPAVP